jgi:hypothetical protein
MGRVLTERFRKKESIPNEEIIQYKGTKTGMYPENSSSVNSC